jgi:EthD domain
MSASLKLFELLVKRPDISDDDFHDLWRRHAAFSDPVASLRQYVQAHRAGTHSGPFAAGGCEGVAEAWFDDLGAALGLADDPAFLEGAAKDEPNFLDTSKTMMLFAHPVGAEVGSGRAARTDRVKLLCFLRASGEGFDEHRPSAEEVAAASGAQLVKQWRAQPIPGTNDGPPFAGVDEVFFADSETASRQVEAVAGVAEQSGVVDVTNSIALVVQQLRIV